MKNLTIISGKANTGKTTEAIKEALLVQKEISTIDKNERLSKAVVIVSSEAVHLSQQYLDNFESITGVAFNPRVLGVTSIEEGMNISKNKGNQSATKNGVLVLEDYDLLNKFTKEGKLSEEEMTFLNLFDTVILPVQTSIDGLINYNQMGLIQYITKTSRPSKVSYSKMARNKETGTFEVSEKFEQVQ